MKINGNLVFNADASGEIQNVYVERVATNPADNNSTGRLIYRTDQSSFWYYDGSQYVEIANAGDISALQTEIDAIETASGGIFGSDGTYQGAAVDSALGNVNGSTNLLNALSQLDTAITNAAGVDTLGELTDVTLGGLADNDLLQYNSSNSQWENVVIGSASGVQAHDDGLDALAALSGSGYLIQTGADTYRNGSLVAPAAGITISNANGVAGNSTFALANDLAALEGLSGTGIAVRIDVDTWAERSVATASATRLTVADGDGVAGNPTLDLATVANAGTGTFLKFTRDAYGRVEGTTAVVQGDITALVDSVYVNVSGDTMNADASLVFSGTGTVTGIAAPVNDTDATNKAYVDALVAGLSWKDAVRAASTANIDLATGGELTIDGVALSAGDRVLVKDQTSSAQNGIYIVAAGAWSRASDMDDAAEFDGAAVFVQEGSLNEGKGYTQTKTVSTVDTDSVVWSNFSGGAVYTWGVGLEASGNTININLGAGIQESPSDEVGLHLFAPTGGALILTTDGTTSGSTDSAAALHLLLDGSTLAQSGSGLKVDASGITELELNSSVAGNGLSGGAGSALAVNVDGTGTAGSRGTISIADDALGVDMVNSQDGVTGVDGTKAAASTHNHDLDNLNNVAMTGKAADDMLTWDGSDWVNVTRASLFGGQSVGDLSDVTLGTLAAGDVLVYNGTDAFENKQIHYVEEFASATSFSVVHNLGQQFCQVTCYDSANDEVVIPNSITYTNANTVTVTTSSAVALGVIVTGVAGV